MGFAVKRLGAMASKEQIVGQVARSQAWAALLVLGMLLGSLLLSGCKRGDCGALDGECCPGGLCGKELTCDLVNFFCIPESTSTACGTEGKACCENGTCVGVGLDCTDGQCVARCGDPGVPCCANETCGSGLSCQSGVCFPPPGTCEGENSCTGCVDARCGWCTVAGSSTRKCVRGAIHGPSTADTCARWDFGDTRSCGLPDGYCGSQSLQNRNGEGVSSADACAPCTKVTPGGDMKCGWCDGVCRLGLEYGPLGALCNDWRTEPEQCCEQLSGCDACTEWTPCGYCAASALCGYDLGGSGSSSSNNLQCDSSSWETSPSRCSTIVDPDDGTDPQCNTASTCSECSSLLCDWCDNGAGGGSCRTEDTCPSNMPAVTFCPRCYTTSTCNDCQNLDGCTWCDGLVRECVTTSNSCPTGSSPVSACGS